MDHERWQRIEAIVDLALDLETAERATFIERACDSDGELRSRVVAFLAAEEAASGFLETPVEAQMGGLVMAATEALPEERLEVGPYRLVRELGRGGMGSVFLAERADGQFEQRVALKLIKRGMDSEAILRRFLAERQILARLEHANVARLLDGGISRDDRPYFAMEYVEGEPIARWCDERRLAIEPRIALFLQVCAAVEHAHRHLVVHRDLKPSNILVTEDGQVKLLDFGIAKLLAERGMALTLTHHDTAPMTPEYAAPEQVSGEPVTTQTDVYALGLLLYELFSGRRACQICEHTPTRSPARCSKPCPSHLRRGCSLGVRAWCADTG
ncbi:MAG: serine/threonine protein kinase, partial [Thermoanaerobaculia bacterium]|nr:serine/threonine protein kinase [Thermoanaerobaculia bacterium]